MTQPAVSPSQTLDFVFVQDMTAEQQSLSQLGRNMKADRDQRALRLRYASVADAIEIEQLFEQADQALQDNKPGKFVRLVCEAVRVVLNGWQGMTILRTGQPALFIPDRLETVLDFGDAGELRSRLMMVMGIGASERKKSAWRLPSEQDKSASPAAPATA